MNRSYMGHGIVYFLEQSQSREALFIPENFGKITLLAYVQRQKGNFPSMRSSPQGQIVTETLPLKIGKFHWKEYRQLPSYPHPGLHHQVLPLHLLILPQFPNASLVTDLTVINDVTMVNQPQCRPYILFGQQNS